MLNYIKEKLKRGERVIGPQITLIHLSMVSPPLLLQMDSTYPIFLSAARSKGAYKLRSIPSDCPFSSTSSTTINTPYLQHKRIFLQFTQHSIPKIVAEFFNKIYYNFNPLGELES